MTATGKTYSTPFIVALTIVLTLIIACTYGFGRYLFRVLLVEMRLDLGFTYATAGLLNAAITIGYLMVTAVMPSLTERVGAVRLVLIANLVCGIGLLLMASVSSLWLVALLLALFGVSTSGSWVPMVNVVRRFAPPEHQVKILGLIVSGVNYGIFVNGLLAPPVIAQAGWRPLWTITGVITIGVTFLAVLVVGIAGLLPRSSLAPLNTHRPRFSWRQKLRGLERPFLILILMHGVAGFYGPTFGAYISAFIQDELGLSVILNGQVWTIMGVGGMLSGLIMGWLGDRIGPKRTIQLVYTFGIIATLLVLHHQTTAEFLLAGLFSAFGFIPMYGLVAGYISRNASTEQGTFIFSLLNFVHGFTVTIGSYLGGLIQTWTGTFMWVYLFILVAVILALALSTILPDEVSSEKPIMVSSQPGLGN